MQNCALTLVQMGYEADVNSADNLVKVVKRLPVHLQSKWADRAGSLALAGTEPTFMDLSAFVEEKALLANTTYGRIVGSTPDKERSSKPPPGAHHLEPATTPYFCHGVFTDRSIFSLKLSRIQIPKGTSVTNCNHTHGLMSTCRHDVDMFT